jgi:anti-sigma regulatory factor (Ser/Thr protein kinase)
LRELALHLLDIAENSIAAGAVNIHILVKEDITHDRLQMEVKDDGKGMDEEMVKKAMDPFITSRTIRKVGLGIPLLKEAAEACNGSLKIESAPGAGTTLVVDFQRSHIDRMPLGDLAGTFLNLVVTVPQVNWTIQYYANEEQFAFENEPIRRELRDIPATDPMVLAFLREMIESGVNNIKLD